MTKQVEKHNNLGSAYSTLGNVHFKIAQYLQAGDQAEAEKLIKELPLHLQVLKIRLGEEDEK